MSHEILQNRLEKKSDSGTFKLSEVLLLANRKMLREPKSTENEEFNRRYPLRYSGEYCGLDIRMLISSPKARESRDLFLTPEGSPEFVRAHIVVSGPENSVLYTYAEKRLYVSDSTKQFIKDGLEQTEFKNPIEVTGHLAQIFNYMMLDVKRPKIIR